MKQRMPIHELEVRGLRARLLRCRPGPLHAPQHLIPVISQIPTPKNSGSGASPAWQAGQMPQKVTWCLTIR
jgi:hypothetical protein